MSQHYFHCVINAVFLLQFVLDYFVLDYFILVQFVLDEFVLDHFLLLSSDGCVQTSIPMGPLPVNVLWIPDYTGLLPLME